MPQLHAVFSSGFPHALKKTMAERKRAMGDGNPNILAYFSKKARCFQMQMSEHKMYLIFCLYRLERLQVNTNPKN